MYSKIFQLPKKKSRRLFLLAWFLSIGILLQAQNLNLTIPHHTVQQGEIVDVEISASNFLDIVSIQFSINWDPSIIEFQSSNEMDLGFVAVGQTEANAGNLRISWFDIDGVGETMDDGLAIINLKFMAIGENGDFSDIMITDQPLEIQIFQDTGADTIFQAIDLDIENGSVAIEGPTGNEVSIVADISNINCNGEANGQIDVLLVGEGNYTFSWQGPNGFTSTDPDIQDLSGGDYLLQVLDEDGIIIIDTIYTIVQPLSTLVIDQIQADTTDCDKPNGSAAIFVSGGTAPYSYDIGFGFTSQNTLAGLAAGNYSLTIEDANGCSLTNSFTIESPSGFSLDLGENIVVCEGEEAFIESPEANTYLWSTGETESAISVNNPGVYYLTVTDEFDCLAFDSITVELTNTVNVSVQNDTLSICPGDSIQLAVSGADSYFWPDDSGSLSSNNVSNPIASPTATTVYDLIATSDCGEESIQIEVEVFEITATAGRDTCVAPDTQLQLNASGGEHYYWIGGGYPISDYNIANPYTTPEDSTSYSILIVDANGCSTIDEVVVVVGANPTQFVKRINLITPNGDGQNDNLYFGNISKYGPNTLKIFNRWGASVYDRVNYQFDDNRFDGTYKDKPLPAGTYYYVLSFRNGEDIKQTLTIVRE